MNPPWVPILCYHRVCPKTDPEYRFGSLSVTPERFSRQMSFLKWLGYRAISLQDLTACLAARKNLPKKCFVITFDDGYEDNYLHAFPILRKFSWPATIFLVTGHIGKTNAWDSGRTAMLKPEQIEEMQRGGIIFGSHTASHIDMSKESAGKIREELAASYRAVEAIGLRKDIPFCYPYTRYTEEAKSLVKQAGYLCAVAGDQGKLNQSEDLFDLWRVQIFPSTGLFGFWKKLQPWYPRWQRYQMEKKSGKKV